MYVMIIAYMIAATLTGCGAVYCWESKEYYYMAACIVSTLALLMFAQVVFTAILHRRIMGYGR